MEHTSPPSLRCRHCRSRRVCRSRFRPWELPGGLLGVRPYRCCKCAKRFWGPRFVLRWPWRRRQPVLTLDELRHTPINARLTPFPDL